LFFFKRQPLFRSLAEFLPRPLVAGWARQARWSGSAPYNAAGENVF
jgi:hypothetical protein